MATTKRTGVEGSRTATIVFTDLVASTTLRTRLGDAAADRVFRAHEDVLGAAVTEHGGTVVKSLGDGILAAFPGAADAVEAATAIQQATQRANRRVDDTQRLAVRVGLSAGDVLWDADDCHGTPVVTASRLCDRADGDQVLCDDLVRGLARGRTAAEFRLVGEVELKGLPEPVVVYEIPWSDASLESAPLPALLLHVPGELPFAGRDTERQLLTDLWKSVQSDGRAVALVSGEPGVGKTRLTSELAREAHADGAWVLAGRCDETVSAPFAPWVEILRHAVTHCSDELLGDHVARHGGELTRLVPELGRRAPDVPAPRSVDPETERLALFDAVLDLLATVAVESPVFVVIDDAHWSDTSSLHLLGHIARRIPIDSPVMVVVTYRDTDIDRAHPLASVIGDLRREPRVERYALRGLDEAGVVALLTAAGGSELEDDGRALAQALARETEGNLFFVGEILRHLTETGAIVYVDGQWRGTITIDEVGIPEGIRDVVGRRLSRLSDDANETLRTAAVVGREFPFDVVAEIDEQPEDVVLGHVEDALGAQLLTEVSGAPGRMAFAHALVRTTLLEELSTTRRIRLHRRIGEALERRGAASHAELAYHFAEAAATGVTDRAVAHCHAAALEAQAGLAFDEAIRFFDRALEALDAGEPDAAIRSELLAGRAMVQHQRGDPEAGRRDALAAAAAAREVDDPHLLAEAGFSYQGLFTMWAQPSDPVGVGLLREGLAGLADDQVQTRARATAMLAASLLTVPGDEALALAEEAAGLAEQVGDHDALAASLNAWGWALRGRGRADEVCAVASRGIAAAAREGAEAMEFGCRYTHGQGLVALGDFDAARAEFERTAQFVNPLAGWAVVGFGASGAMASGRLDDADALIEEAFARGGALGATNESIFSSQRLRLAMLRGDMAEMRTWSDRTTQSALGTGVEQPVLLAREGDLAGARDAAHGWEREIRPLLPTVLVDYSLGFRVESARLLDDPVLAEAVRVEAEPFAGQFLATDLFHHGAAEHVLGVAALVEGRADDAVGLLDHAVAVVARCGFDALVVAQSIDLARALLVRGRAGDRDRAQALLAEALEAAERMGLGFAASDARELLG